MSSEKRDGTMTRRTLLLSLPALAVARRVIAQAGAPMRARALNHMTLSVSDPKRTIDFYQGLFGMPVQARQGATTLLRIGSGPQFLAVSAAGPSGTPGINHYCLTVENFNVDRILKALADHGVSRAEGAGSGSGGPMKVRVRMRGPETAARRKARRSCMSAMPTASSCSCRIRRTAEARACAVKSVPRPSRRPRRDCSPSAT